MSNQVKSIQGFDLGEKFHIRPLGKEFQVYAKYFKSPLVKKLSFSQIALAIIMTIAQICAMCFLRPNQTYSFNEYFGSGIFVSIVVGFSATITILASQRATHCKLHLGMTLNIIVLIAHILVLCLLIIGINLRRRSTNEIITRNQLKEMFETALNKTSYRSICSLWGYSEYELDLEPQAIHIFGLFLVGLMAVVASIQIVLSFVMAVLTGRAIHCGRSLMDGRFLELDSEYLESIWNQSGGKNMGQRNLGLALDDVDETSFTAYFPPEPSYNSGIPPRQI